MDEQQQEALAQFGKTISELVVAFTATFQPLVKALVDVIASLDSAITQAQDAHHYKQATGLDYDPSRIVQGSLASDVLLIPERAESLVERDAMSMKPLLLPERVISGTVHRESIGFLSEPYHSRMLPNWTPDPAIRMRDWQKFRATWPDWARQDQH